MSVISDGTTYILNLTALAAAAGLFLRHLKQNIKESKALFEAIGIKKNG
jgi:hypothetical protein